MKRAHSIFMLTLALAAAAAKAAPDEQLAGRQIYQSSCVMCHQDQAQGAAGLAPPLKGSYWDRFARARAYVPGVLLAGMHGPISTDEGQFIGLMPPQNRLSDEEIAAVANYLLRDVNGQAGSAPLTASEVAAWRARPAAVAELRTLRKQALTK